MNPRNRLSGVLAAARGLAALTIFVGAVRVASADVNVLANPGFETGSLAPWYQDRSVTSGQNPMDWTVTTSDAHTGAFSATDKGNKRLRQDFTPIPASLINEVSFWIKHPLGTDPPQAQMAVTLFYSDGFGDESVYHTQGLGWEFFNVTPRLIPNKSLTGLGVWGYTSFSDPNEPPTFYDDLKVVVVPEPGGAILGIAAMALLAGSRRGLALARDSANETIGRVVRRACGR